MKRLARATALALVAALALSGCIRYNVDMTLSEDDTASGTVVIAVEKGVSEQMGVASDEEALTELFGESPFGPNFTAKEYAEGDWVGQSYTFDAVPITDLADLASLFTVTREGDVFAVDGEQAPVSEDEKSQMPPGAESKLSITFPGEVIEHNGTLEGKTVTWDLFTLTDPVHATGNATGAGSGSGLPVWLLIGGGIALLVLVGAAVAVILLRRRGTAAPIEPAPLYAADEMAPVAADAPAPPAPPAPPTTELPSPEPPAPPAPPTTELPSPEPPAPPAPPTTELPSPPPPSPAKPAAAPKKRAPRVAKPAAESAVEPAVEPVADGEGDGKE